MLFSFILKVNGGKKKAPCPKSIASRELVEYMSPKVVSTFMINLTVENPDFVAAAWVECVKLRKKLPSFGLHSALYKNMLKSGNHAVVNRSKQMLLAIPGKSCCVRNFHDLVQVIRDVVDGSDMRMLRGRVAAMEYMVKIFEVMSLCRWDCDTILVTNHVMFSG